MPDAVSYYDELVAFRRSEYKLEMARHRKALTTQKKDPKNEGSMPGPDTPRDYLAAEDYLFMPQYPNRSTAMEKLGKIFAMIIKQSGLEEKRDKTLTLYSLRHTAIMYRLINSDIDSLALAKNARTSQAVIEKFYGSHLTTDHVRKKLHSFKVERLTARSIPRKPSRAEEEPHEAD